MSGFLSADYRAFELFAQRWGIVTAGTMENFNSCTVSWGSLGTLWGRPAVTVYVHPARHTCGFLEGNDFFTVSFYDERYRDALAYMGAHSGRDGDKAAAAGLTPLAFGQGVTYEQAELTLLCRKLYAHQFGRDALAPEVQAMYAAAPDVYPDFQGGWQPHIVFVGEVIDALDKREHRQGAAARTTF